MRRWQAKDIPDVVALKLVAQLAYPLTTTTMHVHDEMPWVPYKVVAAKLSKLLKRGLIDGCDCGCRGDWHLTQKGAEIISHVETQSTCK